MCNRPAGRLNVVQIRPEAIRLRFPARARYCSIQSAASLMGSGASRHGRHCASRPRVMSPLRSSTFRCLETAGGLGEMQGEFLHEVSPGTQAREHGSSNRMGQRRKGRAELILGHHISPIR